MATLGNTTTYGSFQGFGTGQCMVLKITPPVDAQVETFHAYCKNNLGSSQKLKCAIWLQSDNTFVAEGDDVITCSNDVQWRSVSFTDTVLSGSVGYYIGVIGGSISSGVSKGTDTAYDRYDSTNNYASPQTLTLTNGFDTAYLSIYVTYSEYSEGPGYTIEGQTPNKINTLPWSSVGSIT